MKNSSLMCNGTTTFTLNKGGSDIPVAGGGLGAHDDAVARLSGNVCFMENEAIYGGGMYIDGSSQLVLKSPVTINFDARTTIISFCIPQEMVRAIEGKYAILSMYSCSCGIDGVVCI